MVGYIWGIIKDLRLIIFILKVVESNTGVILGYTVQYKFVNIISRECTLHNTITQDCHFVNECRQVFCRNVICRKKPILMSNYTHFVGGSVSKIN